MFLKTVMERNQPLVRLGIEWQQSGVILPDTYLLDYDTILENARSIKQAGDANGVQNFFMLKQIGRNPLIARALTDMGYVGAVCVDFREALTMVENQIPLGNVGHLVQIPPGGPEKDPPRKAGDRNGVHAGKSPRDQRSLHRAGPVPEADAPCSGRRRHAVFRAVRRL